VTARHIARELAVIVLPQLSKKTNFEDLKLDVLIAKTVSMLCDYAKHNLSEADSLLQQSSTELVELEVDHPENAETIDELKPVLLTTEQLKQQVVNLQRAINLISEALDVPALSLQRGVGQSFVKCEACGHTNEVQQRADTESDIRTFLKNLLTTYWDHRDEIDLFIKRAKSKWQVTRMVSIDRDILRLACAEAFFMPDIPISVAINEAVELCHRFADEKAAKFINGVLGDLAQEARYFRNKGVFPEPKDLETPNSDVSTKPNGKSPTTLVD
jgi:transcription antitermination protein NusB